jgi:hypothetical protein
MLDAGLLREAVLVEIEQGRLVRHPGQPRILAHQEGAPRARRFAAAGGAVPVGEVVEQRLGDDAVLEVLHLLLFEFVGSFGKAPGGCVHGWVPRSGFRAMPACRLGTCLIEG